MVSVSTARTVISSTLAGNDLDILTQSSGNSLTEAALMNKRICEKLVLNHLMLHFSVEFLPSKPLKRDQVKMVVTLRMRTFSSSTIVRVQPMPPAVLAVNMITRLQYHIINIIETNTAHKSEVSIGLYLL